MDAGRESSMSCQPGRCSLCAWQGEQCRVLDKWRGARGNTREGLVLFLEGGLCLPARSAGSVGEREGVLLPCQGSQRRGESTQRSKGIQGYVVRGEFGSPVQGKGWTGSQGSSPWGLQEAWEGSGPWGVQEIPRE